MTRPTARSPRATAPTAVRTTLSLLAVAATAATTLGASSASAAEYRAYSCRTPTGAPASSEGWKKQVNTTGRVAIENNCAAADQPALTAQFSGYDTVLAGEQLSWTWDAPQGVTVKEIALARSAALKGVNGSARFAATTTTPKGLVDRCESTSDAGCWPTSDTNAVNVRIGAAQLSGTPGAKGEVTLTVGCEGGNYCESGGIWDYSAELGIRRGEFLLDDPTAPTATSTSGTLLTSEFWRGSLSVTGTIGDGESGARGVALQRNVGGTWRTEATRDAPGNAATCTPVDANGGVRSYTTARPCSPSITMTGSFDTDTLPEGHYRVVALDAAGNAGDVAAERPAAVDRTPPASDYAGLKSTCTVGERIAVLPETTDAVSGVAVARTEVVGADGSQIPIDADGTIECPASSKGPMSSQTTAKDKAGNEATITRQTAISVQEPPAPPVEEPPAEQPPVGQPEGTVGNGGTVAPKPTTPVAPTTSPSTRSEAPAVQPVAPPATSTTPAAEPGTSSPTAAADALLQCTRTDVLVTEAYPLGKNDIVRGVADKRFVGKTVAVRYGPARRVAAKAKVDANGVFVAAVKSPKGKQALKSRARYQAVIGNVKSAAVQRARRIYTTNAYGAPGGVRLTGRLTKPFVKGAKVEFQVRGRGCSSWSTVKTARVGSSGKYAVTVPRISTDTVMVVRAVAHLRTGAKTVRTTRTASLPAAVQLP
jgi:hypothetical protein